jgi:hemoglobin
MSILLIILLILLIVIVAHYYPMSFPKLGCCQKKSGNGEGTLYDRLGGIYPIAAVIDHFSDSVIQNPKVGKDSPNPALREWHRHQLDRLPGLKFMRTLWVCDLAGGPYKYVPTVPGKCPFSLENAHAKFHITSEEFDAVAGELAASLDHFGVPAHEKGEVLAVFAKHKSEIII